MKKVLLLGSLFALGAAASYGDPVAPPHLAAWTHHYGGDD